MNNNKIIFVTGGTGNQGGAVARSLATRGFAVKVLTRNPGSAKALNLKNLDIQVVKGDLNDTASYREYLKDAYGIFSVQALDKNPEREIKQGCQLATIGKESGVKHFLYSSALGAELNTGVPHIDSKFKIENHVQQTGVPFTIIRPSSLYENFLIPQVKKGILKGKLVQPINRKTILQYVAAEDIGKAAAKIFENGETYIGRILPLATEQLSTSEVAQIFSEALNKNIEYKKLPALIARIFLGKSIYKMFEWANETNRFVIENIYVTKEEFPGLLSLKKWIETNFKS
ncbi:MAG: NmrA/HSCARG family protein [Ginsengibacter sp.]